MNQQHCKSEDALCEVEVLKGQLFEHKHLLQARTHAEDAIGTQRQELQSEVLSLYSKREQDAKIIARLKGAGEGMKSDFIKINEENELGRKRIRELLTQQTQLEGALGGADKRVIHAQEQAEEIRTSFTQLQIDTDCLLYEKRCFTRKEDESKRIQITLQDNLKGMEIQLHHKIQQMQVCRCR